MTTSTVSGMASRIRACNDNEAFDLGGQNEASISHTISQAFKEPFPLKDEMVRVTFIVGAGKLGRQRYDDNATKAVTVALRTIDFKEDHGASCVVECAGTFKLQHDTGKNLKTVVVFPRITTTTTNSNNGSSEISALSALTLGGSTNNQQSSSPEHVCAISSQAVFTNMLKAKCPSWLQKKGCLNVLSDMVERTQMCDNKLIKGEPLIDSEQEWYDAVPLDDIHWKETLVKKELAAHVDESRLTAREKQLLLTQVVDRIEKLDQDVADAKAENKVKKAATLTNLKTNLEERKKVIEGIKPQPPHRIKNYSEIVKLRQELKPLLKLEESCKGRLLTLKETTTLARKDEIFIEIQQLEDSSRGWFEDDDAFAARVQASRSEMPKLNADNKKAGVSKKPSMSSSAGASSRPNAITSGGGGWSAAPLRKKPAPAARPTNAGTNKATGGIFASMMADSDSD